jgi:HlyD family secretion protein
MRKMFSLIVVAALLVGGVFIFQNIQIQRNAASLDNYQTVQASRGNLTATVGATGAVKARQTALLNWKTNGIVDEVYVDVGDFVEAGTLLASLVESSLPQNVILARADLTNAQRALDDLLNSEVGRAQALQAVSTARQNLIEAERGLVRFDEQEYQEELDQARENILEARDNFRQAEEDFEPYEDWNEDNATRREYKDQLEEAEREYEEAIRALNLLELERALAHANLELRQAQLAQAEREFDRLADGPDQDEIAALEARIAAAEATIMLASIEAPFDGVITEFNVRPGDNAVANQNAFRIDDLSRLLLDVRVSEVDINRIHVGNTVNLTFDAIQGREYRGVVTQVSNVGTVNQGIVEFLVTVELEEQDEYVKPGMTAAVNVVVERLENVLLVPNRAVRSVDGQRVVYVIRNGSMERVSITLGATSDTNSEVANGDIRSGDEIVLNPPANFTNGPPPFMRR